MRVSDFANPYQANGHSQPPVEPITMVTMPLDGQKILPGQLYRLSVTLNNAGDEDSTVKVALESQSRNLHQWCNQPEHWTRLPAPQLPQVSRRQTLIFEIAIPNDAQPQTELTCEVVLHVQRGGYLQRISQIPHTFQVMASEQLNELYEPAFTITPYTSPQQPLRIDNQTTNSGIREPIQLHLTVHNHSDRVDRYFVECVGLPSDWQFQPQYSQTQSQIGIVPQANSVGVNPGEETSITLAFTPPPIPLAGIYHPTIYLKSSNQSESSNQPERSLMSVVYFQIDEIIQIQPQLVVLQDKVSNNYPAQFIVELSNQGNHIRTLNLELDEAVSAAICRYRLAQEVVQIQPQSTASIPFVGQPKGWWRRPWWGKGKDFPFQLKVIDQYQSNPDPRILPGHLTWLPRPWWQLLLVALAGLGLIGTIIFLIWLHFLRPPTAPQILEFSAEDSRYQEANQDMVRLRWQIQNPQQIRKIKLTGLGEDGQVASGPLVYEFPNGKLPSTLQQFCQLESQYLSCNQVRSDAFAPGKYTFELEVISNDRRVKPTKLQAKPAEVISKPSPQVKLLEPVHLVYQQTLPGTKLGSKLNLPKIDEQGIKLNWTISQPQDLAFLNLIGRDQEGKQIGNLIFKFEPSEKLPIFLSKYCKIDSAKQLLLCNNFPTELKAAGTYRFELQAIARGQTTSAPPAVPTEQTPPPQLTEPIRVEPPTPRIISLKLNGKSASAKVAIPLKPRQAKPQIVQVEWRVMGAKITQVEIQPAPGLVPLSGKFDLPISQPGSTNLIIKASVPNGESVTRSVTLEAFQTPGPDPAAAIQKALSANQNGSTPKQVSRTSTSSPTQPSSKSLSGESVGGNRRNSSQLRKQSGLATEAKSPQRNRLYPVELPPQF
ncbi:hypothetical protein IQ266_21925 [filamentous cyanobacterium LEGE 11480]|uniref:Uncharacterized protein n=1 Tax=Romeriopsis navalis LEGE 11480 TaxID=2777977 RepID=A0A928Z4A8_9CYAN|nr:hypothetical protein [Romeriopsis navalis]MBE9032401.1 hypothetical protein [Romeriopsis navalis LEGE 11480]